MRTIQLVLPDAIFAQAEAEARGQGLDITMLCSTLLADLLLSDRRGSVQSRAHLRSNPSQDTNSSRTGEPASGPVREFDVAAAYPGYPRESVALAQAFIDEALKYGNAKAFKTEKGVGVEPNFAFVEYLRSRRNSPGICVSLYGNRKQFHEATDLLTKGRTPSYSRASIGNSAELRRVLPLIREAYSLKLG